MVSTIKTKVKLKFVFKKDHFRGLQAIIWAQFESKLLKSEYFQSIDFCSSVSQTHNINQHILCPSAQLKNNISKN